MTKTANALLTLAVLLPLQAALAGQAGDRKPAQLIDQTHFGKTLSKHLSRIAPQSLDEFKITVTDQTDLSGFSVNRMHAEVSADIDAVWKIYTEADLSKATQGKSFDFGFAYSRRNQSIYYRNEAQFPTPHVGMGIFLVVRALGIKELPVGFEITRISPQDHTLEFTYLNHGNTAGKQIIRFEKQTTGGTRLSHITYYRSEGKNGKGSPFRDRHLYAPVHETLVRGLHANILRVAGLAADWQQ